MKVKIGDTIYNSELQPIMIILSESDKSNIAAMHEDKFKYVSYPNEWTTEEITEWVHG